MVFGLWPLAFGLWSWPLVFGLWPLIFGYYGAFDFKDQRPKAKDQTPTSKVHILNLCNLCNRWISSFPSRRHLAFQSARGPRLLIPNCPSNRFGAHARRE